jgi:hypothetical protein
VDGVPFRLLEDAFLQATVLFEFTTVTFPELRV